MGKNSQIPNNQPDLTRDDSILEEAKTSIAKTAAEWAKPIGEGLHLAGEGIDLFTGLFKGDVEGKEAEEKWKKEEEQAKVAQIKRQEREKQIQQKLMSSLGGSINTMNSYIEKIQTSDITKATEQLTDMWDILDSTEGDMEYTNNNYGFKNRSDYEKYINDKVTPALIELMKRKNKAVDSRGSTYAYSKMREQEGSEDLVNTIADFSRELTTDVNTQAMKKYWSDGKWGMGTLQTLEKAAEKTKYWIDAVGTEAGILNPDIVSDLKYSKGGAAAAAGAIEKNAYSALETGSDIWDGIPEIITNLIGFKGATKIEGGVTKLDSMVGKMGKVGAAISKYNDTKPMGIEFAKNMLSDTFAFDITAQTFTGKPLSEEDVSMNLMMNLPINAAIGFFARPAITGKALAQQFDLKRTFAGDGTINVTQKELELIKQGRSDLAEVMILNRSKLGGTDDVEGLINIRNITQDDELVARLARTSNNLERTIENAKKGVETANQTLQLNTALNTNALYKASASKLHKVLREYDNQSMINRAIAGTIKDGAGSDNAAKFWNMKVMEQVRAGGIDIDSALTKIGKTNPEYADSIELFKQMNNLTDGTNGFSRSALKSYGVSTIKRQYGQFLQDLYKSEVVDGMKLVEGERVSPIHVFSEGKIKNVETGDVTEVSDFFKKQDKTAYQKKALKTSVLDDVVQHNQVFSYFTKKLGGKADTSELLAIFGKKSFSNISQREATLIRAALSNEIMQDLIRRGKDQTVAALMNHPAYKIFKRNDDGTYSLALKHIATDDIQSNLGTMFKNMDEQSIVKYLGDIKAQDDIIESIKTTGLKNTVEENIKNQPPFLQNVWRGFSEMLMRKTTTIPNKDFRYGSISKHSAKQMIGMLQRAFPNIEIVFGKLPDGVKGSVMPYGGKIVIDESKMSAFTSLHEFGHIWIMHAKAEEGELYEKLTSLIKKSNYYKDVQNTYKGYYSEDYQMIDEAIAHAIEDSGKKFFDSLQKQTFLDSLQALFNKIYSFIKGTSSLDKEVDAITAKMFNADKPITKNNLAELDMLQFTKEDFDKNSYFIRHVIQKINEDDLFLSFAKKDDSITQQEFIFQIINSMIKNTVPSSALDSTVRNYTQNFDTYMKLVNKDTFTEQYINSEIAKFETANVLRSMMPKAIEILKSKEGINLVGSPEIEEFAVEMLGTEIVRLAKASGLKRLFRNGSVTNVIDKLAETISNIKNSDIPLHEKQRLLIEQSLAYSNTYLVDTVIKQYENSVSKGGKPYNTMPKMIINGKEVEVDPNILFQALQVMRFPEFAMSDLSIKDYLKQDYIRKSLPKWKMDIKNMGAMIESNEASSIRLQYSVPVDHIPAGKTVIVTLNKKADDVTYAKYSDDDGLYLTMNKFLETDLDPNTNYLVPTKFFNQATKNPEMIKMVEKIKQKGKNIYPVEFTVIHNGPTKYVEQDGFHQLSTLLSIKRSGVELPEFTFVHAPSVKGMSRLSENTSNAGARAELGAVLDGTYHENSKAEKYLTDMGANPVPSPVVLQENLIHDLGSLGKIGEIIRTSLRGIITKQKISITDKLINGTIITENAKEEWLQSITGNANLNEIYIDGKTVTELADDEISNIDIEDLVDGLDIEEAAIARLRYAEMLKESKGTSVADEIKKYKKGSEAFDAIIDKLVTAGKTHTEVSNIVRTMISQNPGWAKDIYGSKAIDYIPSFDSFIANKIIAPILAVNNVDIALYTKMIANEYDSVIKSTFGSDNNFKDNDHIIALFVKTMQEQGVLPETLDVYAVISNLLPEDRKHLHDVINNYYQGDIWKLIGDENTSEYFKTTFSKLKKTFLGVQDTPPASFTNEDVEKGIIEIEDAGDEAGISTRLLDEKDADTNLYETIIGAFLPKLKAFNDFEKEMMSPDVFKFGESTGKPLYELEINLNTWSSQPDHKVLKDNRASLAYPQTDVAKASENGVKLKAYNIFDKKSDSTILKYKDIDAINLFEKQTFDSPKDLQDALEKKEMTITVGERQGKIGEKGIQLNDDLLADILKRIENLAFIKSNAGDITIFSMITKNGTPRSYNIANLLNSPIFRTLIEEYADPIQSKGFKLRMDITGKDQGKASISNAYIGYPVEGRLSSTEKYLNDAKKAGIKTNDDIIPSRNTVAFISVAAEGTQVERTIQKAQEILKTGGTVVMDRSGKGFGESHSGHNIKGEGAVQDALGAPTGQTSKGYNYWGKNPEIEEIAPVRPGNTMLQLFELSQKVSAKIAKMYKGKRYKQIELTQNGKTQIGHIDISLQKSDIKNILATQNVPGYPNHTNVLLETKKVEGMLDNGPLQRIGSSLRNIERKYKERIAGGEQYAGKSNNLLDEEGMTMVKNYLRGLVGGKVSIVDVTHFSPIDEVMMNGNSIDRVDKTIEKNTDVKTDKSGIYQGLNDYRSKPIDTKIIKGQLTEINEELQQDAIFILTDKSTRTYTDASGIEHEYVANQPIDAYDFTFRYKDIDKKSKTVGQTYEVTLKDGVLSEPKIVEEIIDKPRLSNTIDPESKSLYESARAEICNL